MLERRSIRLIRTEKRKIKLTKDELYTKLVDIQYNSIGDKNQDKNDAEFVLLCYIDDADIHRKFREIVERI